VLSGVDLQALRIEREELCGIHADVTAALSAEAGELLASGDCEGLRRMQEVEREVWERLVIVERLLKVN
jgi:hypothetical protein